MIHNSRKYDQDLEGEFVFPVPEILQRQSTRIALQRIASNML